MGRPTKPANDHAHYVSISFDADMWDVMEKARKHAGRQIRDRSKEVRRAQEFFYVAMGLMAPPPPSERTPIMDVLIEALATRKQAAVKKAGVK